MSGFKWILELYAMLASVPFLIFPLVGLAVYAVGKDKKTAVRRAMDVTMFFLIGSVSALYDMLFHTDFKGFWIILLLLLLMTGLLGNAQNRMRGKVDMEKLLRAVWRLGFMALAAFYLLFIFIVIVKSIMSI